MQIDRLDRKILLALQADGRLTNAELAEQIGLSASQCSRRRSQLEKNKIITSYSANVAPEQIGIDIVSMISINLAKHDEDIAADFRQLLNKLPNVQDAFALTGEMDYSIKVVSANLDDLSKFINTVLLKHPAVQNVRTSIVLDKIKSTTNIPVDLSSSL